jgi:hypothetical protein
MSGEGAEAEAEAGFRVAGADLAEPSSPAVTSAIAREDGRTEAALMDNRTTAASLTMASRTTALRALGISLCLLNSTLGRILLFHIGSLLHRLKLAAGATLEGGIHPE